MADIDTAPQADTEVNDANPVETMKSFFLDNSQIKPNGIREVNKAGFSQALLSQGVSDKDVKRVQTVLDHAKSAATELAADDLIGKIESTGKDDLANDEYRRGLSSTVRIPTPGGKSEITVSTESVNNIPFRGDADGNSEPQKKTTYGRIRVSQNATSGIQKDLPGSVSDRIKASLGISE